MAAVVCITTHKKTKINNKLMMSVGFYKDEKKHYYFVSCVHAYKKKIK